LSLLSLIGCVHYRNLEVANNNNT